MTTPLPTLAELARKVSEVDAAPHMSIPWSEKQAAREAFVRACTPETILALAAEVEGLQKKLRDIIGAADADTKGGGQTQWIANVWRAIDTARTDRSST